VCPACARAIAEEEMSKSTKRVEPDIPLSNKFNAHDMTELRDAFGRAAAEEQFKPESDAWRRLRGDEAELIYVATFYGLPIFVGVRHSVQKEVELRYVIRDLESLIERPIEVAKALIGGDK